MSANFSDVQSKPWMQRRPGETVERYRSRLAHSCYACGRQYRDLAVLRLHEDTHTTSRTKTSDAVAAGPGA
jgi:hypothetical protein